MKSWGNTVRRQLVLACCCFGMVGTWPLARAQEAVRTDALMRFDIPALPLAQSLALLGQQSGVQVTADADLTRDRRSPALRGSYSVEGALRQLLDGSGLEAQRMAPGTFKVLTRATTIPAEVMLPQVRVEATVESIYEQPRAVNRITRVDIDRTGPRHASEILQATPGVYTATNEQVPSVSVNIRGLKDFGRVNMNIDGVRQNFQRSGHGQRNGEMFFDTEFLRDVEVSKGPMAEEGGAGVTAGVATFRTIDPTDILQGDARYGLRARASSGFTEYRNGQKFSGSLATAARFGEYVDALAAYSRKDTDQYQPGRKGEAFYWGQNNYETPADVVNGTGQDSDSYLAKARWFASDALTLKLTALGTDVEYGESQQINLDQAQQVLDYEMFCKLPAYEEYHDSEFCRTFEYDPNSVYLLSNTNRTRSQSYALDAHYDPAGDWIDAKAKLYYVTTRNTSLTSASDYRLVTRTDTIGGTLSNVSLLSLGGTRMRLSYGGEAFRDENRPEAGSQTMSGDSLELAEGITPNGQRQIGSVWGRADWSLGRFTLSPGLRWDYYRLWGTTGFTAYDTRANSPTAGQRLWQFSNIEVDHRDSKLLPTLGLAFDALSSDRAQLQLFANAGLGWRPPQITETLTASAVPFHNPPVKTFPNWMLKPEETRSFEAGFNFQHESGEQHRSVFKMKLVQFYNRTENYILYTPVAGLPGGDTLPFPGSQSMYVNAVTDLIFQGQELQIDYTLDNVYGSLDFTHTERSVSRDSQGARIGTGNDRLSWPYWPLGGIDLGGPGSYCPEQYDNADYNYCNGAGTLYDPMVPEYSGRLRLGAQLWNRSTDIGFTLTCASRTGHHGENGGGNELNDVGGQRVGLRSFCVVDGYGSHQLNPHFSVGYNLKNIGDRKYMQAMGDGMVRTYAPGRTLLAFVNVRF